MEQGTSARIPLTDGEVDLDAAVVLRGGDPVGLTPIEQRLLRHLAARSGQICGRDELLVEVWGYRPGVRSRTVDNTVRRLREKIERDPANPVHLHAVYGRGLKLVPAAPDELPGRPISAGLVGRRAELDRALRGLAEGRLVSLTGPPGAGKTRLAAEITNHQERRVVTVDFRGVTTPTDVLNVVAAGLEVAPATPTRIERVLRGMGDPLLVLDGCERVMDALRPLLASWLDAAERMQVLVASRVPVELPQERRIEVGALGEDEAAALFCRVAARKAPEVAVEDNDELRVLVRAVDQMPLAIELAAARVSVLSVRQMIERLDRRLDLLDGAAMRRTIDGSLEDLGPDLRRALGGLAVFAGRFALDDAEAVLDDPAALDLVQELVHRGLVSSVPGDPVRYALYEVVRDRVREVWPASDEVERRHAGWYGRLWAPTRDPARAGRLRAAFAELRAAADRHWDRDPDLACRCAVALLSLYSVDGPLEAGLALADRLESLPLPDDVRAQALYTTGDLHLVAGRTDRAAQLAARGLELAQDPDSRLVLRLLRVRAHRIGGRIEAALAELDEAAEDLERASAAIGAWYHRTAGEVRLLVGDTEAAEAHLLEGRALARRAPDPVADRACATVLASVLRTVGRFEESAALYEQALEGDLTPRNEAVARFQLALLDRGRGRLAEASAQLDRAEVLNTELGNDPGLLVVATERAMLKVQAGQPAEAEAQLVRLLNRAPMHPTHTWTWLALSAVRILLNRLEEAAHPLARARALADQTGFRTIQAEVGTFEAVLRAHAGDLAEARARLQQSEPVLARAGRPGLAQHHAVAAWIEARWGDPEAARSRLKEAETAAVELGLLERTELWTWIGWARGELRSLGPRLVAG